MRKFLLKTFPFLGPCHKCFHKALQAPGLGFKWLNRQYEKLRYNVFWEYVLTRQKEDTPEPVVHVYTVCRNEALILPYFLAHYQQFSEHIFVYDQGSTDGSLSILQAEKDVTVVPVETDGTFDEALNIGIKNTVWKQSAGIADFVVVCDVDEFLYHPRIEKFLRLLKQKGFTLLKPHGYQMVAETLKKFDGETLLTSLLKDGVSDEKNYSKTILFDPNRVEINFFPGSHRSAPAGAVKVFHSDVAKLLHYKYVDREEVIRKTRTYRDHMSAENVAQGYSRHYMVSDEAVNHAFDSFLKRKKRVV